MNEKLKEIIEILKQRINLKIAAGCAGLLFFIIGGIVWVSRPNPQITLAAKEVMSVAEEIRKLAENSGTQAKKISKVLKDIKGLIDSTSETSSDAQQKFEQVVELSEQVKNQEETVQHAVSEQASGGNELLQAIQQMNMLMQNVKENSEELKGLSAKVMEEINEL